jgi:ParB-like chromosome segregation protein Spo0J
MRQVQVDPRVLRPNPWNTNRVSPENMVKLKRSITDLGFVSAVVARQLKDKSLEILGGQHRTEAAIELGLATIPVLDLGFVDDDRAKKIGLIDNARYGTDDTLALARLLEEIGATQEDMASILPFSEADITGIFSSLDIDLDRLGDEDEEPTEPSAPKDRPLKTHEVMRFRLSLADAERVRKEIERIIGEEGFNDEDEMSNAGRALAFALLSGASS